MVGRVRSRLKRLRQPKYLVGALVGVAYVYFLFFRRASAPRRGGGPAGGDVSQVTPDVLHLIGDLGAYGLLVVVLLSWFIPRRASLAFSEAEIAFLFPAPVSRRMLIHYRLLGSQFALAFTALILTLVFGRGNALGGNPLTHAIGWWVILATLNLHLTGSSFVQTKLLYQGVVSVRRKMVLLALATAVAGGVIFFTWNALRAPGAADFASAASTLRYVSAQLHSGPLPWLLAIPRLVIAPFLATDVLAFALAMGPALLVLVMHYFWVLHSEVSFEEASIARAEKRATRKRDVQQGDWRAQATARKAQREPFSLAGVGRPELAFLWKNLISTSALFRPRSALIAAVAIVAGSTWLADHPAFEQARLVVLAVSTAIFAVALLLGPQIARQDLRADLPNSDILKTYPLRGWQIVLGELLTPVAILTVTAWLALLAAALMFPPMRMQWLTPQLRAGIAIGLGLLAPAFCALQLLLPNAAAVLFPAWVQMVGNRSERGLEVLGQRIIFLGGQLLIATLALVPAAIGAAVVFLVAQWLAGPFVAAAVAVATTFAVLVTEVWLGIQWLGHRFERFDLSAELRP